MVTVLHEWEDGGLKWRIAKTLDGPQVQILSALGLWVPAALQAAIEGDLVDEILRLVDLREKLDRLLPALKPEELALVEGLCHSRSPEIRHLIAVIDRLANLDHHVDPRELEEPLPALVVDRANYVRGWNEALAAAQLLVCPEPRVEEERDCDEVAAAIHELSIEGDPLDFDEAAAEMAVLTEEEREGVQEARVKAKRWSGCQYINPQCAADEIDSLLAIIDRLTGGAA